MEKMNDHLLVVSDRDSSYCIIFLSLQFMFNEVVIIVFFKRTSG